MKKLVMMIAVFVACGSVNAMTTEEVVKKFKEDMAVLVQIEVRQ